MESSVSKDELCFIPPPPRFEYVFGEGKLDFFGCTFGDALGEGIADLTGNFGDDFTAALAEVGIALAWEAALSFFTGRRGDETTFGFGIRVFFGPVACCSNFFFLAVLTSLL